jgi:hypothetical protein
VSIELERGEAVAVDWPASRYFSDLEYQTRSGLGLLASRPSSYYRRFIEGALDEKRDSAAMTLGTHVHLALLEPEEWARRVLPEHPPNKPDSSLARSKKGSPPRQAWDAWVALDKIYRKIFAQDGLTPEESMVWETMRKSTGAIAISPKERAKVESIAAAVSDHPCARDLISLPGESEKTILWREPTTGVGMKVRTDRLTELDYGTAAVHGLPMGPAVIDLKTSHDVDPQSFARSAARFGYHDQAAIYSDAASALYGTRVGFLIIAVATDGSGDVAVYQLDDDAIELGRKNYLARLHELLERREKNNWLASWQHGVQPLTLPRWTR